MSQLPVLYAHNLVNLGVLDIRDDGSVWRVMTQTPAGEWRPMSTPIKLDALDIRIRYAGEIVTVPTRQVVWVNTTLEPVPSGWDIDQDNLDQWDNSPKNLKKVSPRATGEKLVRRKRKQQKKKPVV